MTGGNAAGGMQLIARAADVLRALRDRPEGLTLSELGRRTGLPKTTTHRLVGALAAEQFVSTGVDGPRIRLGPGLTEFAAAASGDLRQRLRPYLQSLHERVEETIDLGVLDGDHVRFIDQIPASHRLRAVSAIGARFPLYCTANGKALLAALPREQAVRRVPSRPRALTATTLTSRKQLWQLLDEVARTGLAYDLEEHTPGISAVGTAVCDPLGQLAAITIVVPTQRFNRGRETFALHLLETRAAAQRALAGGA
jgi:DNA-binding IclR family transcriptional regulator